MFLGGVLSVFSQCSLSGMREKTALLLRGEKEQLGGWKIGESARKNTKNLCMSVNLYIFADISVHFD